MDRQIWMRVEYGASISEYHLCPGSTIEVCKKPTTYRDISLREQTGFQYMLMVSAADAIKAGHQVSLDEFACEIDVTTLVTRGALVEIC